MVVKIQVVLFSPALTVRYIFGLFNVAFIYNKRVFELTVNIILVFIILEVALLDAPGILTKPYAFTYIVYILLVVLILCKL